MIVRLGCFHDAVRTHVLSPQGDLLVWLLSAAFAHDSTHSQAVLAHARARDELLMATMELRERAMALHLHIPHKFTLNTRRERVDVHASWAAVISKVEQVSGPGSHTSKYQLYCNMQAGMPALHVS